MNASPHESLKPVAREVLGVDEDATPEACRLAFLWRLADEEFMPPTVTLDAAAALERVVAVLEADPPQGARIRVLAEQPAQGWGAPPPPRWLDDALAAASEAAFGRAPGYLGEGGSIPFLAELGRRYPSCDFVATGVLGPGSNAHGPDEALHLPTAIAVTEALALLLEAHAQRSDTHG